MENISVLTLTQNRLGLLRQAMESVANQHGVNTEHIIVADRCDVLADKKIRDDLMAEFKGSKIIFNADVLDSYLPNHLANLRNKAYGASSGEWIAVLDDDNQFEVDHCASLIASLRKDGNSIGHSWRSLWKASGDPWLMTNFDPWVPNLSTARYAFRIMEESGVYSVGSNIVKDRLHLNKSGRIGRIDTNEWMFTKSAFRDNWTSTEFTPSQMRLGLSEDVFLTIKLAKEHVPVSCNMMPTVRYSMGGYSNENHTNTCLKLS